MNQVYNHALPPGARIDSFEILDVLGVGGFGITYRAFDATLQQTVAIKEYLPDGLAYRVPDSHTLTHRSESDVEHYQYGLNRFLEEARTLARFRDPSIVRVVRFIEDNGTAYLVMDYEQGQPLAQRLRQGTLSEAQACRLMLPLLRGLQSVHSQHFLHRDVKPSNILLRSEGPPVLLDFGAARQAFGQHTKALTAMVTPGYAPFEQYHSEDRQGPWTDLYGLGATLYHCIGGFAPPAATERIAAQYDGDPDPVDKVLDSARASYSPGLIEIIAWLLQPHAKERPQSTDEVLQQMENLGLGAGAGDDETPLLAEGADAGAAGPNTLSPQVLKTVQVNLEQHIGPMADALVRKAGKQVNNVGELTQLLARFIPDDEQKTQFLGQTRMLERSASAPVAPPASAPEPDTAPEPPTIAVSEHTIQHAKQCLAAFVGPIAGMLVRKAAKRADDREEFTRRLADEVTDERQRAEFLRLMKTRG